MAGQLSDPALLGRLSDFSHVALAVSGGSDSLALMHLAAEWRVARGLPAISVLTVDHGLRAQSGEEALQVAGWAKALGLRHETLVWGGVKPHSGLMARAREARYALMSDWCRDNQAPLLMTAHTMDDQAETVAMRLARTSTAASLAAIWRERDMGGVILHRPLLKVRRAALRDYLRARGQEWLDDPSNEQERFERVRIRRALNERADDVVPQLAGQAAEAARQVAETQQAAREWASQHLTWKPEGYGVIDRQSFSLLTPDVQNAVLQGLLETLAGTRAAPQPLASLAQWLGTGGASRRSLGGVLFGLRRSTAVVGREAGRIPRHPVALPESGMLLWDHRFRVEGKTGTIIVPAVRQVSRLAPPPPTPRFIRDGWPCANTASGEAAAVAVTFMPCLR
jgi:tRNA(Ile)-lysidine synthase